MRIREGIARPLASLSCAGLLAMLFLAAPAQAATTTVTIDSPFPVGIASYNAGDTASITAQLDTTDPNEEGQGETLTVTTSTGFSTIIPTYSLPQTFTLPAASAAGTVSAFISGADGDEAATVSVTTASNCSATVPTPMPSPPDCPIRGWTQQQKHDAQVAAIASAAIGGGMATSSVTGFVCGPAAPACVAALEFGGLGLATANGYLALVANEDPPDPNFMVIAQPMIPTVAPVIPQGPITPAVAAALNAMNANDLQIIAYAQAAITSGNRAQGAANAGNAFWESAQFQAEQSYSDMVVTLIAAEPGLLANLQTAWVAAGYGTFTLTPDEVLANENAVAQNGLPTSIVQALTQAGADSATITLMKNLIVGMDINKVAGTFPARLSDSSFVNAVQTFVNSIVIKVAIDVKPDADPPSINPNSKGNTPVAILSSSTFNAPAQVDQNSLTFGHTGDEKSLAFCSGAEDVNGDGLPDLVCHFTTNLAGFQPGDTVATLKGRTTTGRLLEGTDSIVIVPR